MTNASEHYVAVPCPDGSGVAMVPRPGSAMERAVNRLWPSTKFYDAPMRFELQPQPGTAQNNLGLPGYRPKASPPERRSDNGDRRYRGKDQQLPDPDYAESDIPTSSEGEHQEPDGDEVRQILAEVPAPPDGYILNLYQEEDDEDGTPGVVALILEPDTGRRDDPTLNTNDRMRRHRIRDGKDPTLVRMNQINRGHYVRDAETVTSTLIRHRPQRGERLVLKGPNEWGSWELILYSPARTDMTGEWPRGAEDDLDDSDQSDMPAEAWVSGTAGKPGEHELPTPTLRNADRARFGDGYRDWETTTLRQMNQANARFWEARR
jgi:hypothetical protein